jgi:hypothetical protein
MDWNDGIKKMRSEIPKYVPDYWLDERYGSTTFYKIGPPAFQPYGHKFKAGDDMIMIDHESTLDSSRVAEMKQRTAELLHDYPPKNGPLRVQVAAEPFDDPKIPVDTGAFTLLGTSKITVNPKLLRPGYDQQVHFENFMPSAEQSGIPAYVITHEYGHVLTPTLTEPDATYQVPAKSVDDEWSDNLFFQSVYGQSQPAEGFAEAFAEWDLTEGKTETDVAREYASRFHWRNAP